MEEDGEDTRTRLLRAAAEVIERDGETEVRIRDVSSRAGVSYASLYHFFGDRSALIAAAQVERFGRSLWPVVDELATGVLACRTRADFVDLVRGLLERVLVSERSRFRWTRVEVLGGARTRPELAALLAGEFAEFDSRMADALRPAQAEGWIPADLDLAAFSSWLHGMVTGRLFAEVSGCADDGTAWNRIAIDGVLAVLVAPA